MKYFYLTRKENGVVKTDPVLYNEGTGSWQVTDERQQQISHTAYTINIGKKDYASNDTNVTIDETYNQLVLTCDLDEIETLVDSPTDEEGAYSPFVNKQKYAVEYVSWGEGSSARNGFKDMVLTGKTSYDGANIITHYAQIYLSNVWKFNGDQYIKTDHTGQLEILKKAKQQTCTAFLAEFGKTEPSSAQDNSIPKAPDMQRYLVISINGNGQDEEASARPTASQIEANIPLAEYVGNINGGFFSPADNDTTNYFIISGKMICTSWEQKNTGNMSFNQLQSYINQGGSWFTDILTYNTVHLDDDKNGDGAFYAVQFFDANKDTDKPYARTSNEESLFPYNSEWKSLTDLNYGYSAAGDETDRINKFPILQCTVKIGEKYACEMIDSEGNSYYEWHTLDDCPYETYQGSRIPRNHIFIGANIAIDEQIIGKEYEFANNVRPEWNIDESGIAIPIKKSDGLSGQVSITIDGPVNSNYEQVCRRHPTFFRSTKWWTETKKVLAHINQIMLKDFKVEIYSDNALINNIAGDKDLIYQTEELTDYVEKKDDIDFKLSTQLTTEECAEKGIKNTVLKNNPYIGEESLREIRNTITGFSGKPEEQYLNDYWPLYNQPRQIVETTVHMRDDAAWNSVYKLSTFNSDWYPMSYEYDVKMRRATMTLREM